MHVLRHFQRQAHEIARCSKHVGRRPEFCSVRRRLRLNAPVLILRGGHHMRQGQQLDCAFLDSGRMAHLALELFLAQLFQLRSAPGAQGFGRLLFDAAQVVIPCLGPGRPVPARRKLAPGLAV